MEWLRFKSGWQCPKIPKNGSSTLSFASYYERTGNKINNNDDVWIITKSILFKYANIKYKTFIVYRDPYERLKSLYTDLLTGITIHDNVLKTLNYKSKDEITNIKEFINRCFNNYINDSHINKIVNLLSKPSKIQYYKTNIQNFDLIDNIDTIVNIKDLPEFIKNELKIDNIPICNKSNKTIDTTEFETYKEEIIDFYKEDYEFIEKYKDKIWNKDKYIINKSKKQLLFIGNKLLNKDVSNLIKNYDLVVRYNKLDNYEYTKCNIDIYFPFGNFPHLTDNLTIEKLNIIHKIPKWIIDTHWYNFHIKNNKKLLDTIVTNDIKNTAFFVGEESILTKLNNPVKYSIFRKFQSAIKCILYLLALYGEEYVINVIAIDKDRSYLSNNNWHTEWIEEEKLLNKLINTNKIKYINIE